MEEALLIRFKNRGSGLVLRSTSQSYRFADIYFYILRWVLWSLQNHMPKMWLAGKLCRGFLSTVA